ncbi:MAG: hypothetical protein M0Z40_06155 [Actinomycetota bacterium]|nr:hypothetical protein [Actinomycetota bacterium]
MPRNDRYRRYLDAAAVLGQITRARAEELMKDLMGSGDDQRAQAQQWVDELVDRGRDAAGDLVDVVRAEVSKQLQGLGLDPEELARQAADVMRRSAAAGRRVVHDAASGAVPGTRAPGGRAGGEGTERTGRPAATTKAAATKAAATKAAAKKAATTKAAAKKAPVKKAATTKAAAKKAPAKKVATTKAAATKAPAKKAGPGRAAGATRSRTSTTGER